MSVDVSVSVTIIPVILGEDEGMSVVNDGDALGPGVTIATLLVTLMKNTKYV